MLITFNFSYLENFFVVFYFSFNFILAPGASAHVSSSPHEVLDANLEARVRPVFTENLLYYPFVIESLYLNLLCLSAALLCYTGFQTIH